MGNSILWWGCTGCEIAGAIITFSIGHFAWGIIASWFAICCLSKAIDN